MSDIFIDAEGHVIKNSMVDEHSIIKITEKVPDAKNIGKIICGETNSNILTFEMNRFYDNVDMISKNIKFIIKTPSFSFDDYASNVQHNANLIRFSWVVPYSATQEAGNVNVAIEFFDDSYSLKTMPFIIKVDKSINSEETQLEVPANWYISIESRVLQLENKTNENIADAVEDYMNEHPVQAVSDEHITEIVDDYMSKNSSTSVTDEHITEVAVASFGSDEFNTAVDTQVNAYLVENGVNAIKNLINPDTCLLDTKACQTNGNLLSDDAQVTSTNYITTPVIPVKPNETYIFNKQGYLYNICFANADGLVKSVQTVTASTAFTVPSDMYYMRYSFTRSDSTDETWKTFVMLCKGDTLPSEFLPYGEKILLPDTKVTSDSLPSNLVTTENISQYMTSNEKITDGTVFNDLDSGVVLFTMDGVDEETYDAIAPYADSLGIPITFFLSSSTTESLVSKIHADSYNNYCGLYTGQPKATYEGITNYTEQYNQFKTNYDGFVKFGFGKPLVAAYAGGIHGDILENILHEHNIKLGRTTSAGVIETISQDMFNLSSTQLSNDNCITQVESTLKWNYKKVWVVTAHSIASDTKTDSYYLTEENMKACLDIIKTYMDDKGVTAMNLKEYWEYMTFPHDKEIGSEIVKLESDNEYHKYMKSTSGWKEITF